MLNHLKIITLNENREGMPGCDYEHGLSIVMETDKERFLMDMGQTDIFARNAKKLGIDLSSLEYAILSHGHYDHGGGLAYLPKGQPLICHPEVCLKRYSKRTKDFGGIRHSLDELSKSFDLKLSKKPYEFAKNCWFLGEIERIFDFEAKEFPMTLENGSDDTAPDDTGIAFETQKGLVIISSCAHSGICNTIEQAKRITGRTDILAVVGGFHLKEVDDAVIETVEYFRQNKVQKAIMGHCTSDEVIDFFQRELSGVTAIERLGTGNSHLVI